MRKIKYFFSLLLTICFTFTYTCTSYAYLHTEEKPTLSAKAAVLIDKNSKAILYGINENERLPMASTTKIMTAIIAIENLNLSDKVTITAPMTGAEGSSIYLKEGECFTVEELLYGLMLKSGNDAAVALAIHTAGSVEDFVKLMNIKAKNLGLENTSFKTPNGLDEEGHHTTAYELAKIAAYALDNDTFSNIVSTRSKNIGGNNGLTTIRYLKNGNKLLKTYDCANGVKTGYTKLSGRCLVSSATKNSMTLIAVTLNDPDDWDDHTSLLNYGFENFEKTKLMGENKTFSLSVVGGKEDEIKVCNKENISLAVPKDGKDNVKYTVNLPRFVYAPIKKGNILGSIDVYYEDEIITRYPLITQSNIEFKEKRGIIKRLFGWLFN